MPQKKKSRLIARRKGVAKKTKVPKLPFLICGIILLFFLIFKFGGSWDGQSKLKIAVDGKDAVYVLVIDPTNSELTTVLIPKSTQVVLSRKLGTFALGNVWEVGENEGGGGEVLTETITKNFLIPVESWGGQGILHLASANPKSIALTATASSSLSVIDRLKLTLFGIRVKNFKKATIDLAETTVLTKTKLVDGTSGYIISRGVPQNIASHFSESQFSKTGVRVVIYDATGTHFVAEEVGEVVQTMGGKIVSVIKQAKSDSDCLVASKRSVLSSKLALLYGCEVGESLSDNFDLEISLGSAFSERY